MNTLETLKDRLKIKPIVQHNVGVKVIIAQPVEKEVQENITKKTEILIDKDDGKKAQDILEKIKQKRITSVVKKTNEEAPIQMKVSQAPIMTEEEKKKKKPKLLKKDIILIEEEEEPIKEVLPEGGPRLDIQEEIEVQEKQEQIEEDIFIEKKPRKRVSKKSEKGIKDIGPEIMIQIGDTPLPKRIPPPSIYDMKVSSYYMNNREIFINFINGLFEPYKEDLLDESKGISCADIGKDTGEIGLLTHQKIVRDYMNLYTPYRGLLLYHGLGSGKTCTSIAITIAVAEGLKKSGKVVVMTPASLRRNYIEEIKKCGDLLFRKKQYWEWISVELNPELVDPLSAALGLPREYIRRRGGAWLTNITKPENYADLTSTDKKSLNDQLDEMIGNKYTFINYNGLRRERFKQLTNNFETNIFDNSIVVIDEAHNFISRIVNKINKISKFSEKKRGPGTNLPNLLALQLYEFLLRAENCRVVLLTGTPIINYPNEIAILFNILRGYIKTWSFSLNSDGNKKITKDELQEIFAKEKILDYYEYVPSSKTLTITRNPFGFENKITTSSGYKGVTNEKKESKDAQGNPIFEERKNVSDDEFIKRMTKLLKKHDINAIANSTDVKVYTALPDTLDEFANNFIDRTTGVVSNIEKFKRRIIGLTSYFRSAQEELLPAYDKEFDKEIVLCPMSDYQFSVYETYRQEEREREKPSKKIKKDNIDIDGLYKEPSSTYKIFSRLACNFVMPQPPGRPTPAQYRVIETLIKRAKLLEWMKQKYSENKEEFNKDIQEKYDEFIVKISEENTSKYALQLHGLLDEYINKYLKEDYRESIEIFIRQKGYDHIFDDREEKEGKEKKTPSKRVKKIKGGSDSESESDSEEIMSGGVKIQIVDPGEDFIDEQLDDENAMKTILEDYKDEDANLREADELEGDEILEKMGSIEYKEAIKSSLRYLQIHSNEYLSPEGLEKYSPKFLEMLNNIDDHDNPGLHLVYSQFRSMEGIGIFSLVLEANGYARFKIKRSGVDTWEINMAEEDYGKPCYALYTGTEDDEEREIIRNIYNGQWEYIPNNIAAELHTRSSNNNMGEIIKVLMITSAGSEGINLRNTRFVHIMEPYWHPVRVEQVIGRARRICSHQSLSKELQTVHVFVYVSVLTEKQLKSEYATELRLKDSSKYPPFLPQTTDQLLLEISNIKENLASQLLKGVKESSIDCATHAKSSSKEGLVCLSFGQPNVNDWSYNPSISQDENDAIADINRVTVDWEGREFTLKSTGKKYILRMDTREVYDYESVITAKQIPGVRPIKIGKLTKTVKGDYQIVKENI